VSSEINVHAIECFGLFAKYWEPGKVKTRLAATLVAGTLGDEAASEVYHEFVSVLVRRFSLCADRCVLCFTPHEKADAFVTLGGGEWNVEPQAEGDLGARMAAYFDSCFARGADHVVLIGSDSPTMPTEYIESAFRKLRETDVVLGPTEDGGYYLVGMSRNVPEIFDGIDWSTPHVWEQTVARLDALQLPYDSLPPWYDVDEATDLKRLRDELLQSPSDKLAFSELLAAINRVL
jgi:uncharacterized protein